MLELRPEVAAFAQAMEAQLRATDHKPGWMGDTAEALLDRLGEEAGELREVLLSHQEVRAHHGSVDDVLASNGKVLREAADVANFAMMIADVCRGLDTKPVSKPGVPVDWPPVEGQ